MNFKQLLPYIFLSLGIFLFSLLLGYETAKVQPDIVRQIFQQLSEKFSSLENAPSYKVFSFIFVNNTLIDLLLIFSFFIFGLVPLFILTINGILIGLVLQSVGQEKGIGKIVALLAPHGILEIPAFLIAAGASFWLSVCFAKKLAGRQEFKNKFLYAVKIFFYLVLPLNLIAAFIETYITPLIYSLSS